MQPLVPLFFHSLPSLSLVLVFFSLCSKWGSNSNITVFYAMQQVGIELRPNCCDAKLLTSTLCATLARRTVHPTTKLNTHARGRSRRGTLSKMEEYYDDENAYERFLVWRDEGMYGPIRRSYG